MEKEKKDLYSFPLAVSSLTVVIAERDNEDEEAEKFGRERERIRTGERERERERVRRKHSLFRFLLGALIFVVTRITDKMRVLIILINN